MYKYKSLKAGQLPQEYLSFLQNFIITKYLKQEVDYNLSNYMDECSPCGLSITGDIKIYQCHMIKRSWCYFSQWRSALTTFITELLLLLKWDNSSSATQDFSGNYELMISLLPEAEDPKKLFQWCLSGVQIWCL